MEIDQVVAPRKEKYAVQGNALAHYASEYKSRCIDYHRSLLLQHYTVAEAKVESEQPHVTFSKEPISFKSS